MSVSGHYCDSIVIPEVNVMKVQKDIETEESKQRITHQTGGSIRLQHSIMGIEEDSIRPGKYSVGQNNNG